MLSLNHASACPWVSLVEDDEAAGFRGELAISGVLELVQLVVLVAPSGALRLSGPAGSGSVWFEDGSVVHAAFEQECGTAAFQRMLSWRSGHFTLEPAARAPERSVTESTMGLLLDAARVLDETLRAYAGAGETERNPYEVPHESGVLLRTLRDSGERDAVLPADHFERGLSAVWRKDYATALPHWERAALLEPDNRRYRHNLARLRHLIDVDRERRLGEVTDEHQVCRSD
jgi:Domain of unknown function (DUF4388)